MRKITHEPVQQAMNRIRELSADEEARCEGLQERLQKGRQEGQRLTAINLLKLGVLTNEQIAQSTGLSVAEVEKLRLEQPH